MKLNKTSEFRGRIMRVSFLSCRRKSRKAFRFYLLVEMLGEGERYNVDTVPS
jgi:hypothetical protein